MEPPPGHDFNTGAVSGRLDELLRPESLFALRGILTHHLLGTRED
jgi:hypothetical protein